MTTNLATLNFKFRCSIRAPILANNTHCSFPPPLPHLGFLHTSGWLATFQRVPLLRCFVGAQNGKTDICFTALDFHFSMCSIIQCCHELRCCLRCNPLVRLDQILLNTPPAHVSGIVDVNLTRSHPVGAVSPASDLIVVSILTCAHGDFLVACSIVTANIVTASAAVPLGRVFAVTGFHFASATSFSRLVPGFRMTFLSAVVPLSLIVVFHFQTICSLRPCHASLDHARQLHTNCTGTRLLSMCCCV